MASISILYHHPVQVLSFFALLMGLGSLWVKRSLWIWGSFGAISLIGAFESGLLTPFALLPLGFFALILWGLRLDIEGFNRFLLASFAFLLACALFFKIMPEFSHLAPLPYPLCLNYGKAFVGLLLLGWIVPTLCFSDQFSKQFKTALAAALIAAVLLGALLFLLRPDSWHFHFSFSFFPWALFTLFFVIIPEEALLRGFLQQELTEWIGGGLKAQVAAVSITTCLYPLFHLAWAADLNLLLPTFAAGFAYAILYQMTKAVEAPIICHFIVACTYFLCFDQGLSCLNLGI